MDTFCFAEPWQNRSNASFSALSYKRNNLTDETSLEASHVLSVIDHPRRSELWDAYWFLLVILNGDQDSFPDFAVATCKVTRTSITWLWTVHVTAATFVID
jgi:hypothetical protein